jgi:hypothetical protein
MSVVVVKQIAIDLVMPDGAPDCCCGEVEGTCCCSDLADTLYAKIEHWMYGPAPTFTRFLQTDYFTFSAVTSVSDCACSSLAGNHVDGVVNCTKKFWHGEFPSNYPVFIPGGWILPECPTHIVMLCGGGTQNESLIFIFGVDRFYGEDCEYHSNVCDECSSTPHPCPVTEIHIGPTTSCADVHQMWIKDTPWGN